MPRRRRYPPQLLPCLLVASCTTTPESSHPSERAPTPTAAWLGEVGARVRDGAHRFRPKGEAFLAAVDEQQLSGEFTEAGAVLRMGGDAVGVTVQGVGRGPELDDVAAIPVLGACIEGRRDPSGECVRRLEIVAPGITGWWIAGDSGFEQGWTLDLPPEGQGPLTLEMAVEGAEVTEEGDELRLRGDGGAELRVWGLGAWDADGRALPAAFVPTAAGFRIIVDDAHARYPIEVDPYYSSASWSVSGTAGTSELGAAMDGAGDVNGDGYADMILGASTSGAAYVFLGSASGMSTTADVTLEGSGEFGTAVAGAGDVNGDGYDDVIVGTGSDDAYVYHGSATGVETTATTNLSESSSGYAYSVDGAGDVNNDGYDDVVVGEEEYSSDAGKFFVYHGSAAGVSTTAAFSKMGTTTALLGHAVAGAGDVNRDGYDDIVVGAPEYLSHGSWGYDIGAAYLYYGSSAGITSLGADTITDGGTNSRFGRSVDGAGDLDGDGYDDVIVGAYAQGSTGTAYVYAGTSAGLSTSGVTTLTGDASSGAFGWDVAGAGDVNGDGYDDVIVGDPEHDGGTGRSFLYVGSAGGLLTSPWDHEDGTGSAVAGLGDTNGDGYGEVASGADEVPSERGAVFVREGAAAALGATTEIDGISDDELGTLVGWAGDVNGDGYDDVYVTAPGYEDYTGRVFVYHGSASGLGTTAAATLVGAADDRFGATVGSGGDLDGDGYDDLAVAASAAANFYVYLGSATGVGAAAVSPAYSADAVAIVGDVNGDGYDDVAAGNTSYLWIFHGSATGPSATYTTRLSATLSRLAPAGDVNGDGYADVLLGYPAYSSYTGEAFLYYGSSTGVVSAGAVTLLGYNTGDYFGHSLDSAGDVNGDGYDDVVVGGYGYNGRTGRAYFYHGSSAGLGSVVQSVLTGPSSYDYFGLGVGGLGDVNEDGYDDVGVTALSASTSGVVGIYPGSASGISSTALDTFISAAHSVHGAGDVNGDGALDVLLGDPEADGDAGAASLWQYYFDVDGDGIATSEDCDDTNSAVGGPDTVYADADADGYGDAGAPADVCVATAGYVSDATDCDDGAASAHPGGVEVCDPADVDEDCDGQSDDADPDVAGLGTIYADLDGDGYGDAASMASACDAGVGWSSVGTDCDDADAAINPDAVEACDGADVDEDCDGTADDGDSDATGGTTVYADADGDGHGGASAYDYCEVPASGFVSTSTDCDDADAATHPGAAEICDTSDVDEDCDGDADDADASAGGQATYWTDADGDGFGTGASALFCDPPAGYVAESGDCDDATATTHPGAGELCDTGDVDEDCNGLADEADPGVSDTRTFYVDADGDGYGGSSPAERCEVTSGYAESSTDCDDADADDHPGAVETAGDEDDDDCDGAELCYTDVDADGFRGEDTVASVDTDCDDAGEASATAIPDCDDSDAATGGGTEEIVGNGIDEDCDGEELCFLDADSDGFRPDATETVRSADPECADAGEADSAAPTGDCDDADEAFHPGADEANCADPADYNCDGSSGTVDGDGDGFAACEECNDAHTAVNPEADEVCNGLDDDCDGEIDINAVDQEPWYVDRDGDGYADPASAVTACDPPQGYGPATEPDCDDDDATAHPNGVEVADDGIDQDCSGADLAGGDSADTESEPPTGCGCATPGSPLPGALGSALVILAASRRRRRS